jgi:hypothetical protein
MSTASSSPPSDEPAAQRIVLVGHPGHRRVTLFQEALARRGLPPAVVVAWHDLLTGRADLRAAAGECALVRLESPGQDFEVEKLLLAAGADEEEAEDTGASFLPAGKALRLPFDRGRILYPRQWYRGFRAVLCRLAGQLEGLPGVRWLSHPEEVVTLFDKRRCHALCAGAGVPVPAGLGPVRSFAQLRARMEATGLRRVFVKLACGSSGSGVVAFRVNGPRVQAITTVELERGAGALILYNSRRVRCYDSLADVVGLLDALCAEGVQVEEWLPKAELDGRPFDLRVLVISGRAAHVVPRLGDHLLTNLHLLNERGDPGRLRAEVPRECWGSALETCRRAAGLFPRCHHVGVDLLLAPGFRRHAVLEVNAFGDLLPGAVCGGLGPYDAELAALGRRLSPPASPR